MSRIHHVAIIMDGNGRWAGGRRRPRLWGHVQGAQRVSYIVEEADQLNVKALTLFAFSTENWGRPEKEIIGLFTLLKKYLIREKEKILRNNIQFKVVGDTSKLPLETQKLVSDLENESASGTGLKLRFAFDYGGRAEIIQSVNRFMTNNPQKEITENDLSQNLLMSDIGDVDLLIRTGGEKRISNFLLWQMAYAELFFTSTKWPDFSVEEFRKILEEVSKRERRFGTIKASMSLTECAEKASIQRSQFKL